MMGEAQLIELLINGGANAAFAGFLLWQFFYQQKRLDERDRRAEEREDALRQRYDTVISMYQDKEETIRVSIVNEISNLDTQIDAISRKVDDLANKLGGISTLVNELKLREMVRSTPHGLAPQSPI
tara:strand:+ start:9092 stop:9469 length:378 start_codon:yes stop_codon:yes gene_type:complete